MYTGFRADVVVRPEYRAAIQMLHDDPLRWEAVASHVGDGLVKPPGVAAWARVGRASFIPFGVVCYMPDDWGEQRSEFDPESGRWQFVCSLKNYDGEIGKFVEWVLVHIVDSVALCETLYETANAPSPAFPSVALYRLCLKKAAALRDTPLEAAFALPAYALSDLLRDYDQPELMVAAAKTPPDEELRAAVQGVVDYLDGRYVRGISVAGMGDHERFALRFDWPQPHNHFPVLTAMSDGQGKVEFDRLAQLGFSRDDATRGLSQKSPPLSRLREELKRLGKSATRVWNLRVA